METLKPREIVGGNESGKITKGLMAQRLRIRPQCRRLRRHRFNPWVGKMSLRRKSQPTPALLPGESHVQRSLAGYSLWAHKELDMTERLSTQAGSLRLSSTVRFKVAAQLSALNVDAFTDQEDET